MTAETSGPRHGEQPRGHAATAQPGHGQTLPRWQLRFPLGHIVIAEIVAAAMGTGLTALGAPWWALAAVVIVGVLATLNYRGATAVGWLQRAVRRRGAPPTQATAIPAAFSAEMLGAGAVGMRWD